MISEASYKKYFTSIKFIPFNQLNVSHIAIKAKSKLNKKI